MSHEKTYTAFLLAVFLLSCPVPGFSQSCAALDALGWLLGEWEAQSERSITRETWRRVSPDTFEGRGETISRSDPARKSTESLRLVKMAGEVFYIAKPGQNAMPTPFKLTGCSGDVFVFENPEHDFPKRLAYRPAGADSLVVSVSDGGSRGFSINFVRSRPRLMHP